MWYSIVFANFSEAVAASPSLTSYPDGQSTCQVGCADVIDHCGFVAFVAFVDFTSYLCLLSPVSCLLSPVCCLLSPFSYSSRTTLIMQWIHSAWSTIVSYFLFSFTPGNLPSIFFCYRFSINSLLTMLSIVTLALCVLQLQLAHGNTAVQTPFGLVNQTLQVAFNDTLINPPGLTIPLSSRFCFLYWLRNSCAYRAKVTDWLPKFSSCDSPQDRLDIVSSQWQLPRHHGKPPLLFFDQP